MKKSTATLNEIEQKISEVRKKRKTLIFIYDFAMGAIW